MTNQIVHVALPSPLARCFDYCLPADLGVPTAGVRVLVPFARKELLGIVISTSTHTDVPAGKLKALIRVIDSTPLLDPSMLKLLQWASKYYVYPIGEVMAAALPSLLRRDVEARIPSETFYSLCAGVDIEADVSLRAKLQRTLAAALKNSASGMTASQLTELASGWRSAIKALIEKGVVRSTERELLPMCNQPDAIVPELNAEQKIAVEAVIANTSSFQPFLLNGVTGSGKTEVYLRLIEKMAREGKQTLVMVPEISLTPQLLDRFSKRLTCSIVTIHSGLNDTQRAANWLIAAKAQADVVIGTRSSVFTPLPKLGLVIIDEEHDASLKQQDGFRYNARDLVLVRARNAGIPIVLGSATPSLESLANVRNNRFLELRLRERAGNATPPKIGLLDVRRRKLQEGLSEVLLEAAERHRAAGGQVMIFINRRGFAPVIICADCGATSDCKRCDSHMTMHAATNRLRCHHCGYERPVPEVCESCNSTEFDKVGYGSERIEAALRERFNDAVIIRVDRDSTRRKGALEAQLAMAASGEAEFLVGTQMLAKGHHFPNVTLVGILDADRGLFGTDFRSLEQMGQLITQVAGRAGRAERSGEVLVQTRNPEHELLRLLIDKGYDEFAQAALLERRDAELPPYSHVTLVRAESPDRSESEAFLRYLSEMIRPWLKEAKVDNKMMVFGPVVAPMERIAGRYRYQLLLQSSDRKLLNWLLSHLRVVLETDKYARKVRWSIDVDPLDFF